MTKKTRKSPTCVGKVSRKPVSEFGSRKDALEAANFIRIYHGTAMSPYRCNRCAKWHLSPTERQTSSHLGSCTDSHGYQKRSYHTRDAANRRARILLREKGKLLRIYDCDCGAWHLTSS